MKDLVYPSTYHAMKAGPCRIGVCKHEGKCWLCEEYGIIRRYAARDTDRIHELRALVKELADVLSDTKNYACFGCTIRGCPGEHECRYTKKYCLLVDKSREAIGGAEIKEGVTNG